MNQKRLFYAALLVTSITAAVWLATDRHSYTKFEVVENVRAVPEPDDPLAGTGFYDEETVEKTIHRSEFHLGLFPTPQGLFDKHLLSVISILSLVWGPFLIFVFWRRRKRLAELSPFGASSSPARSRKQHGGKRI